MPSSDAASRRRLPPGTRHAEITAAALELFARRPSESVSIGDIAAAAGASPALVVHYLGNKSELAQTVLRQTAQDLIRQLVIETPALPVPVQLAQSLDVYLDYLESHPHSWSALLRAGHSTEDPIAAIARSVDDHALHNILQALEITSEPPVALVIALRGWLALVKAVCLEWLQDHGLERDQVAAMLATAFFGALQSAEAADAGLHVTGRLA